MMDPKLCVFRFSEFEVAERELRITRLGVVTPLEPKALRVLIYLLRNPDRIIGKDELLNAVWGDTAVTENSLTRAIALLRKTLDDDIHQPRFILTIPAVGYRFIADVEQNVASCDPSTDNAANAGSQILADRSGDSQIGQAAASRQFSASSGRWTRSARSGLILSMIALAGVVLYVVLVRHRSDDPPLQLQAVIPPPPGGGFWANISQPAAVSPDGKFLAIISMRDSRRHLWIRLLNGSEWQLIAGTEDAVNPFWSPDSRYIGFFAGNRLKKVDVTGGKVTDLCPVGTFYASGSWSSQGVIVISGEDVLRRVPDGGGTPEPIPGLALSNGAINQIWPEFLPDGKHFLYLEWRYAGYGSSENGVWIASLDGEKPQRLPLAATNVHFASGYLLFSQNGDLYAQRFDQARAELEGKALPVARNIQYDTFLDDAAFSVSTNGILVYAPSGTGVHSALAWMDRDGNTLGTLDDAGPFLTWSISPDGKRVAVGIKPSNGREKIWIYDTDRGTRIPLITQETGPSRDGPVWGPHWSPDGRQVAYRYLLGKGSAVAVHASDGSGQEKQVGERQDGQVIVQDWTPDGAYILFSSWKSFAGYDMQPTLRALPVAGEAKSDLEIHNAAGGKFSPDGHWLAFHDAASGQVYVTPFPRSDRRIAVSSAGGSGPHWRGDGQELFYVASGRNVVSVSVHESPQEFRVLSSHPLFRLLPPDDAQVYDVSKDGKRFLVNIRTPRQQDAPLTLITNWAASF